MALIILNRPADGLALWLLLIPFLETWIKIPMGAGLPDLSFSRFTIAFLAVAKLAKAAVGKERPAPINIAEIGIVGTTAGIMMAAPLSIQPNPRGVIQMAISWYFTPLVGYVLAKNLVHSSRELKRLLLAVAVLGFVSGTYALYEYATGNILFLRQGLSADELSLYRRDLGIRMIQGIWGGTGDMGRALALAIPITFHLFLESRGKSILRIFLVIALIAQFCGIVVAMSRTPWYALLIGLFVMQFFYPQFRKTFLIIALLAAIVLWATWDQVTESDVAARVGDQVSTLDGRQTRWQAAFNMWRAKPIRGWGFGHYRQESGRFRTDGSLRNLSAMENDYLYILVGSGLIGFIPYLLFLVMPLINSVRLFFLTRTPGWSGFIKRETIAVYWAVLLCFAINSYTALITQPGLKLIVCVVAGAVVGSHESLLRRKQVNATPDLRVREADA
jgi:O-antigen ligase